jgi:hypothetical protein
MDRNSAFIALSPKLVCCFFFLLINHNILAFGGYEEIVPIVEINVKAYEGGKVER